MTQTNRRGMFGWITLAIVLVIILAVVANRLTPGSSGADDNVVDDRDDARQVMEVTIEDVSVRIAESYPVQVFVDVQGTLPDACWEPQQPIVQQEGAKFEVEIMAERPEEAVCAQVIVDYEEVIALGEMDPGDYQVVVNGVRADFTVH